MIELLKFLAPWVNDSAGRKAGTLSTVVVLLALAIYAAQTLLLPALVDVAPAPATETAPAPGDPPTPPAPDVPPAADLDATPSTPPDGTSDGEAMGL